MGPITVEAARAELYEIIRGGEPFEEKAKQALDLGVRLLNVENGHLARIDPKTDHWEVLVSTDTGEGSFPAGLVLDLQTTYCRRTITDDTPIALHDATAQGWAADPAVETHGLSCYHGTRLLINDTVYGTICFVSEAPRDTPFSETETMFLELLARLLERELEREHHETQLLKQTNFATLLNRVLRHNLRNDLAVIRGYTQLLSDRFGDSPYGTIALRAIDSLLSLTQKVRELDRVMTQEFDREPSDIVAIAESVTQSLSAAHPDASISVVADDEFTIPVLPSFERALQELIENAIEHGGDPPTVTVRIDAIPNAIQISITDDGPGLPERERSVLTSGVETPLYHGTGIGLWLAKFIVSNHNGSIDASVTSDGTTMTITVPRTGTSTVHERLAELTRARDQYQAAFEGASEGMVIINDDAKIIDANDAATEVYGLDRQKLLGRSIPEFLKESFDFATAWQQFKDDGRIRDSVIIVGADGVRRTVEYSATTDIIPGQHLVISRKLPGETPETDAARA